MRRRARSVTADGDGEGRGWQCRDGQHSHMESSDVQIAAPAFDRQYDGDVATSKAGTATITASVGGVQGTATITVSPGAVATVTVTAPSKNLKPGSTMQLTATATDSKGNTVPNQSFLWSSSNPTIATVSASGARDREAERERDDHGLHGTHRRQERIVRDQREVMRLALIAAFAAELLFADSVAAQGRRAAEARSARDRGAAGLHSARRRARARDAGAAPRRARARATRAAVGHPRRPQRGTRSASSGGCDSIRRIPTSRISSRARRRRSAPATTRSRSTVASSRWRRPRRRRPRPASASLR